MSLLSLTSSPLTEADATLPHQMRCTRTCLTIAALAVWPPQFIVE